jgi:hypothetical protein
MRQVIETVADESKGEKNGRHQGEDQRRHCSSFGIQRGNSKYRWTKGTILNMTGPLSSKQYTVEEAHNLGLIFLRMESKRSRMGRLGCLPKFGA